MTGDLIRAMREVPVPIIAGIQGIAAGAGSVVALASDFRVVTTSARFAFLFTKVGLSGGDMGAAYLLPRVVGAGRATQLLMLGDTIDAETADRYGLVSELVPDDGLDAAVDRLARRLADGPTLAYAQTKALITRELDMSLAGGDGARRDDPGAADDHRRPRGVPRRVQRAPPAALDGHVTGPRTCLVTGAGRGIGAAVAARLAADGHRVALLGRDAAALEAVAATLPAPALAVPADVTDPDAVEAAFARVEREWGPVEVLVSNAGAGPRRRWSDTTDERLGADARAQPDRAVPAGPAGRAGDGWRRGWGRIVVVASVVAKRGEPQVAAYTAAKHGVLGLVRAAAAELARTGVTVNAVCPGYVDTPMTDATVAAIAGRTGRSPEEARARPGPAAADRPADRPGRGGRGGAVLPGQRQR